MHLKYSKIRLISQENFEQRKNNLLNYNYSCTDKSLIGKFIMNPIFEFFLNFVPKNLAPNFITLIGLIFILFSFFLHIFFDIKCLGLCPRWVYFIHAISLFLYMVCDAIDGKQARRTNSGSPLGQLIDHVVDSFVATFSAIMIASALKLGISHELLLFILNFKFCVYFASFEEYFTDKFVLGIINGPTEGILSGILIFLIAGLKGPDFFSFLLRNDILENLSNLAIFGISILLFVTFSTLFTVFKDPNISDRFKVIYHSLTPFTFYFTFIFFTKRIDSNFQFLILIFCESFNFAILILEMIYAHLCKSDIPIYAPSIIFFFLMSLVPFNLFFFCLLTIFSIFSFFIIFMGICNEICDILGIKIFSISKNKNE